MDQFAAIAQGYGAFDKSLLQSWEPKKELSPYFHKSSQNAPKVEEKSLEALTEEYRKGLKDLRKEYEPYLRNLAPKKEFARESASLVDFDFRYETKDDKTNFAGVIAGNGEWESLKIPDYKGPTGDWTGYYRTTFTAPLLMENEHTYISFLGIDYIGVIYVNGKYIGRHEGFFAKFEFDITDYVIPSSQNTLLIQVINQAPTIGLREPGKEEIDGDKIYAATGLGWDDPLEGWHHCPAGAGLFDKVIIEKRNVLFVSDIFVRPDIDNSIAEIWFEITNAGQSNRDIHIKGAVYPKNFDGAKIDCPETKFLKAGPGVNYYKFVVELKNQKLWNVDTPYLYIARLTMSESNKIVDQAESHFGMRKVTMDEESEDLKGSIFFNNHPLILRGANDMGHMQQCVYQNDMEQLIEDILIAKYCNMNFYRFTQRPVQKEIYEYCDMLGMMNQTDLPLFGWVRRNQFAECVKQSSEMEKHIRSFPSSIMITYINEPFDSADTKKDHRHMTRPEMEAMFAASTLAVHIQNPDRIVKHVEGDYDPPTTTGLSDFHCYNMWYTNHAIPIGKLHKGYLPETKKGWKTGCGEYGTEGLDFVELMMNKYPKEWTESYENGKWTPEKVIRAQGYSMHGDWYEEPQSMEEWVYESQQHQKTATTMMTDAFRRRSDVVVSTAVHLLIDAWPAGWMKTLVDCRRAPKPGYFAFRDSLVPTRINLRNDRFTFYENETVSVECWLLNDKFLDLNGYEVVATPRINGSSLQSFELTINQSEVNPSQCIGIIEFDAPETKKKEKIQIDCGLYDRAGNLIFEESLNLTVYPSVKSIGEVAGSRKDTIARNLQDFEENKVAYLMPTEQPRKFQPSHSFENNFPQKERNQTAVAKSS